MDANSILLIIVVLALLIVIFVFYFSKKRKVSKSDRQFFEQKWQMITAYPDHQRAILDADKLLDLALKKKGYEGSLGEKLQQSAKLFSNLDHVWSAHKLRNRIAHELHLTLQTAEAKKNLSYFRQALQDLGFL